MQIPLLRGRWIESGDGPGAPNATVINETLARQQFAKEDPLGKQLEVGQQHRIYTIVGVVQTVKQNSLSERPGRQIYVSAAQFPSPYMSIVARTSRPAPNLAAAIRGAIWAVDSDQPVSLVRSLDDMITERNTPNRILTQMIGFFGVLALLLGAIGIYGLMAQSVEQRTHEIGIRMALGSSRGAVTRLIVGQGLRLTLWGIAFGLLAAAAATRALGSILYQVKANDPVTFVAVAAFFAVVALAACYIPARRGSRVDPIIALRYE
jgi:putative ABC transport system permease protein